MWRICASIILGGVVSGDFISIHHVKIIAEEEIRPLKAKAGRRDDGRGKVKGRMRG